MAWITLRLLRGGDDTEITIKVESLSSYKPTPNKKNSVITYDGMFSTQVKETCEEIRALIHSRS